MKLIGGILLSGLVLAGCATLAKDQGIPQDVPEQGHVVAEIPRTGQVVSFLGDLKVNYPPVPALTLDPFHSKPVKAVTKAFTVELDKKDSTQVLLVNQRDAFQARWEGTVNGASFTVSFVFRSPDYLQKATKENSRITQVLGLTVAGEGIDQGLFTATDEVVGLPAMFLAFLPSGDQVTMKEVPGVLALGGTGLKTAVVSALTWPVQVFTLGKPDGTPVILRGGFLYAPQPLTPAQEQEAALVEVLRGLLRTITG